MQNHTLAQFWDCDLNNCAKSHSCTISVQHRPSWRFCIFKTHLPLDYYHHYWLHYSFWLSQSILLFVKLKESRRRMLMKLVLRQQHRLGLQIGDIIFVSQVIIWESYENWKVNVDTTEGKHLCFTQSQMQLLDNIQWIYYIKVWFWSQRDTKSKSKNKSLTQFAGRLLDIGVWVWS